MVYIRTTRLQTPLNVILLLLGVCMNADVFYMAKIPHHELVYWDRFHYDCVVVQTTGVCSSMAPLLTGAKNYINITDK